MGGEKEGEGRDVVMWGSATIVEDPGRGRQSADIGFIRFRVWGFGFKEDPEGIVDRLIHRRTAFSLR